MNKYKMSAGSLIWYYIINIFSFGMFYFIKITIKKALSESEK